MTNLVQGTRVISRVLEHTKGGRWDFFFDIPVCYKMSVQ